MTYLLRERSRVNNNFLRLADNLTGKKKNDQTPQTIM
jgi:hypothetical protein